MAKWTFEPGHTAAEFRVRHMMVTWVRGHFKDVHGSLEFDPDDPQGLSVEATIKTAGLWTGEPQRDEHLRSADFLDAARFPTIAFRSVGVERVGAGDYKLTGELTVRGVTRTVLLDMTYSGQWRTPYDGATVTRVGFTGRGRIDRHDFGASWNSPMEGDGAVVGSDVWIALDVEAILDTDLQPLLAQGSTHQGAPPQDGSSA
jgi:polyisoprenoid-binding protein YceI